MKKNKRRIRRRRNRGQMPNNANTRINTSKVIDFTITTMAAEPFLLESNLPSDCPFGPDRTVCG
jgi:hypothetical protein